jgi:hypothetical protein
VRKWLRQVFAASLSSVVALGLAQPLGDVIGSAAAGRHVRRRAAAALVVRLEGGPGVDLAVLVLGDLVDADRLALRERAAELAFEPLGLLG